MNVTEACGKWIDYRNRMQQLRLVASSTYLNQRCIAHVLAEALGHIGLAELRKSDVDIWAGERLQTHAPVTVWGEVNVLRQILNWCVDEQLITRRPKLPTVQVPNVEHALPSDEAFLWALKATPVNHRQALELMMLTGLSPHEAERVQLRDYCAVEGAAGGIAVGHRTDFKVKSPSRRRIVPFNERSQLLWVQLTVGRRPLDPALPRAGAMQKALVRARAHDPAAPKDAHRITPKLMRQWFASEVANEQPEKVLQRLLGHAPGSKVTRRHYVRSTDEQLVGAVEALRA